MMAHILVLDDDERTLDLIATLLEGHGHQVTTKSNAEAGIAVANASDGPDLVITDLNMRGINGWDAVRRIRQTRSQDALPILALSAFTSSQDRDEAFEAGCNAYENKPVEPKRLVERIKVILPEA